MSEGCTVRLFKREGERQGESGGIKTGRDVRWNSSVGQAAMKCQARVDRLLWRPSSVESGVSRNESSCSLLRGPENDLRQ